MKPTFYLLTVLLAIIFIFSLINLVSELKVSQVQNIPNIKTGVDGLSGFDHAADDPKFMALINKFNHKHKKLKEKGESVKLYEVSFNFAVTFLTGLAALLSSVLSVKESGSLSRRAAVWIAVITFTSTILNFFGGQLSKKLSNHDKDLQGLTELKSRFFMEFNSVKENKSDVDILLIKYDSSIETL
jgi:hypothetical protein